MLKIVNRNSNLHQIKHRFCVKYYCTNETKDDKKSKSNFNKYIEIFPKLREQFKNKDFQQYLRLIPKFNDLGKSTSTALSKPPGFAKIGLVDVAKSKLYEIQNFYDEFSGMSEVKISQQKVIDIQDQLQVVQDRRRHVLLELTLVRKKIQDLHIELQKASRGEHRYVELVREEFEILAKEKDKSTLFNIIDQEERDLFSYLTNAVKSSHEKERTQANNTKYWSIIGSFIGALLGILGTMINYHYRSGQFEKILKNSDNYLKEVAEQKQKFLQFEMDYQKNIKNNVDNFRSVIDKIDKVEDDIAFIKFHAQKMMDERNEDKVKKDQKKESWGTYLKRHSNNIVSYVIPVK